MPISVDEEYRSKGGPGGRLPVLIWKPDGLPSDARWAGRLRPGSIILTTDDGIDEGTHTWWVGADGVAIMLPWPEAEPVLSPEAVASLVSWWPLDEPTGPRYDAHGPNHLNAVNTPGSAEGVQDLAVNFVTASGEILPMAEGLGQGLDHLPGESFTICLWYYPIDLANHYYGTILCKDENGGSTVTDYILYSEGSGGVAMYAGGADAYTWVTSRSGMVFENQWSFVATWYDHVAGTLNTQIDNGEVFSVVQNGEPPNQHLGKFSMGDSVAAPGYPFNGRVDEVAFFRSALSEADRTALYNEGLGITYAEAVGL